jgi:hypothetical protein
MSENPTPLPASIREDIRRKYTCSDGRVYRAGEGNAKHDSTARHQAAANETTFLHCRTAYGLHYLHEWPPIWESLLAMGHPAINAPKVEAILWVRPTSSACLETINRYLQDRWDLPYSPAPLSTSCYPCKPLWHLVIIWSGRAHPQSEKYHSYVVRRDRVYQGQCALAKFTPVAEIPYDNLAAWLTKHAPLPAGTPA